jgi:alanine racemase
MTHLANADCPEDKTTSLQLEKFEQATFGYAGLRSAANSAGLCAWETSHYDWVRPGIMLYGVSPFETKTGAELGLKSVMTLKSRLISIKSMQQGDSISYGGTWVCPESMSVGVVAIGYGDGYPRHAVSGTPVLIRGKQVPLVGRVTMDMICVDLRGLPEAEIGDEVVLWGAALPVEIIAQKSGTIAYELLCQVTSRVRQVVEHGEE